jgi:hypothetical protein
LAPKSAGGNDNNPGTIDRPFFSLEKLWTVLQPGNLVYLRGGTYEFEYEQYLLNRHGTAGNLIKIWAYPCDSSAPNLTKGSTYPADAQDLIYFEGNYIHWKGIEVANFKPIDAGWRPFRVEDSSNCVFENFSIHHNISGMGIRGASGGNLVLNSDFYENQDPPPLGDYDGADGLAIVFIAPGQAANTIRGCRAWYNADDGFDGWSNDSPLVIEDSWAFYNGYIPGTFNTAGNGSGFKLGLAASSSQTMRILRNNIAYKNRSWGFVENQALVGHVLSNNTAVANGGLNFWFGSWGASRATIRNNISYLGGSVFESTTSAIFSDVSIVDHNSWDTAGITLNSSDFKSMDNSQLLRPRNSDGSLPTIDFLRLAPGSDLIDRGVSVGLPFNGAFPDIGAFESP